MNTSEAPSPPIASGNAQTSRGLSAQALVRAIFKAEIPETFVRNLPAQSLYMAIKYSGLDSSAELIDFASIEQCRLLLDFDCWEKDRFSAEHFWDWLALADQVTDDQDSGLKLLQKVFKAVDLKLIGILLSSHVQVVTFDEKTENPPAPGYYTPDQGHTWILISIEDQHKHFLLARFLALIFETNADIFYQLLGTPGVATPAMLEEEAFNDRTRRLSGEGIPDFDSSSELHTPLPESEAKHLLASKAKEARTLDVPSVSPLVFERSLLKPLATLFTEARDKELLEGELTLLMNAAVLRFSVPYYEQTQVLALAEKVKGAINIGLEQALAFGKIETLDIYTTLGLQKIYRLGFGKLLETRKKALKLKESHQEKISLENVSDAIVNGLTQAFPEVPAFYEGTIPLKEQLQSAEKLEGGYRAIAHISELNELNSWLDLTLSRINTDTQKK